jgi:hypothetical protein
MRCTNCGLPLSPTNTNGVCPRCHTQVGSEPYQVAQVPFPPVASATPQLPFPPLTQEWKPTPAPAPSLTPPATPTPGPGMFPPFPQGYTTPQYMPLEQQYMARPISQQVPMTPVTTNAKTAQKGILGYFIAALCVVTGGLLLVFVYFMGLAVPTGGTLSVNTNTTSPIMTQAAQPSPTATTARPSPTTVPSATVGTTTSFPGQQYITNPQMASAVNTVTAQPTQLTTTFSANQKIYVTFAIHPNGKAGTVCLSWLLNNHPVTNYSFAVEGTSGSGYSYAIYGGTGKGYVQISWANSSSCNGALLAQQVSFTVGN